MYTWMNYSSHNIDYYYYYYYYIVWHKQKVNHMRVSNAVAPNAALSKLQNTTQTKKKKNENVFTIIIFLFSIAFCNDYTASVVAAQRSDEDDGNGASQLCVAECAIMISSLF